MQQEDVLWRPVRPFSRALVVIAHPDDAEFGAAGTVARWTQMGTEVRYVVMTDGASGSADPDMTRERLRDLRTEEQRRACRRLGVSGVEFVGLADGYLEPSIANRRMVAAAVRRHRPEVLVTTNPDVRWSADGYINHPDHRAVGDLALHAINPAASTRLYDTTLVDEGLEPWDVAELWLMGFGEGHLRVDITDVFDTKLDALREHDSQLNGWDPGPRMGAMAGQLGEPLGVRYAEAFTVLKFRDLDDEGSTIIRDAPPTNPKPLR